MVKKLVKFKTIKVFCKCWDILVKYRKWPWRRLLKIHRDRIVKDYNNIFINDKSEMWTDIFCTNCKNRIATVLKVNWKYVNKLNQGQIWLVKWRWVN